LEGFLEAFDGAMPDLDALAAGAEREAQVRKRLAELEVERKRVDEARRDLEVATAELKTCRTKIEELDRRAAKLAFDPEDHARLRKERDEAARLVEQSRTAEREARDLLAAVQRELARLEGVIAQARETADQVDRLRDDARYLSRITALLDGFRNHLVGRIGPALQREAEALFRELTAAEYEDLRINEETLAIEIADGADYFPIERFSGSEVDLANLALRVAISKHLSYMSGADIGMLVLDEVLGSLDVERKDLFVRAMGRLSGHFHQLFVITHAEQVKDQFQAVIEVQKTDRRRSRAVLA
jgi:exonuclease SbcC